MQTMALICAIINFSAMITCLVSGIINGKIGLLILAFVNFAFCGLNVYRVINPDQFNETPEKEYEKLLEKQTNNDKELQKFYIDHPEFKN